MKTVIEMALETGWKSYAGPVNAVYSFNESDLIKFAELVRAEAIAEERDACAKVCDERAQKENLSNHRRCDADVLARAIRARSNT